jgi:glucuronate isomerase
MKAFMDQNFLLQTETAQKLYHESAKHLPIIDYHCHLNPREVAEDHRFRSITELWLGGDHYKWRALRTNGVDERYITGDASDWEKFQKWAETVPYCMRNPIYHWTHLELRTAFGIQKLLNPETAREIYDECNEKLQHPGFSARGLMQHYNVEVVCTTDDPADTLEYHMQLAESGFETKVLPTFRPDAALKINQKGFAAYIKRLGEANGVEITDYESLKTALTVALDRFEKAGCRVADHGFDVPTFVVPNEYAAGEIFKKALAADGVGITDDEFTLFRSQMFRFFGQQYVARNIGMQLHMGVLRNPNSNMFKKLGPDTGFDTILGPSFMPALATMLNYLNESNALPRTVLYSINPTDNAAIGTLCGTYCVGDGTGVPRVVQGSAWWFNDHIDGMRDQLRSYAALSALGNHLGMLTDSRSFLSYPRHEYFRRILCNLIGEWVEAGQYPADFEALAQLVIDICYNNAKDYFAFEI